MSDPYRTLGRVTEVADKSPQHERCTICEGRGTVLLGSEFSWAFVDCVCDKGVTWHSKILVEIYRLKLIDSF